MKFGKDNLIAFKYGEIFVQLYELDGESLM